MIRTGKQDFGALTEQAQGREAWKRIEILLRVRDRSESELRERLSRAGFDDAIIELQVGRALEVGWVDDLRFARLYVSGKKRSGWGRSRIENELKRFGIELKLCEGYPDVYFDDDEEYDRALACLKGFRSAAKDKYAALYRKLLSKGFSTEIISRVLSSSDYQETINRPQ
ncbi:MAG TPA: hypothetical protein DEB24_05930 [Coriobacteriia bacterium]|nr:hypothetical protein [Coriobacteriia bacterium]